MIELILLGGGGHCESVIEVILGLREYTIRGILDPSYNSSKPQEVMGFPILGDDTDIVKHVNKQRQFVITVGQIKSSQVRRNLFDLVTDNGGKLPVIIAKSAYVSSSAKLSEGTVVLHNAFVNANTQIGNCCILNTGAIVEHGCTIGSFTHVSTGSILNGEVVCGENVFIGSGTVLNQGVSLADNVIIASGSLVRKSIDFPSIYGGNPLKRIM
ncbi:NeuD/PglB/VioB family sugar acetyltransferase [Muricauda oceani]|uniref:Acetyltransferase n=1 Tax=Flagellimonas oceani TaxID=2698672 RepID=A0A6G7J681_9FLAO|nr:NeuD/PglB/VioB family sugar acetyltransferase [Allomuricauda oceani]MBW8242635.1 NeuD/PglB/VioB family sugar acetyltransferase [Allomuricauda oceani]QII46391.1 acetyltransferase [Allomuricauda oceani]